MAPIIPDPEKMKSFRSEAAFQQPRNVRRRALGDQSFAGSSGGGVAGFGLGRGLAGRFGERVMTSSRSRVRGTSRRTGS
jgi:hypothetical protein